MEQGSLSSLSVRVASFHCRQCGGCYCRESECECQQNVKHTTKLSVSVNGKSLLKLASAGFCYSHEKGIHCFYCQCIYNNWDDESPVGVHRVLSPQCSFLNANSSSVGIKLLNISSKYSQPVDSLPWNHHCHQTSNLTHSLTYQLQQISLRSAGNPHSNPNQAAQDTTRNINYDSSIDRPLKGLNFLMEQGEKFTGRIFHPNMGNKQEMCRESLRLLTFPISTDVKSEEWARNGFIFIGENNVQCVYCLQCSSYSERCMVKKHDRISPKCPLASGIDIGDVSRELEQNVREKLKISAFAVSINTAPKQPFSVLHPEFSSSDERLKSFDLWSKQLKPTKHQLVEAGFFYTGVSTKVICHCCGLALRDWEETAEAWGQHGHLSPNCGFVKFEKGERFIQDLVNIEQKVDVDPLVTEPLCNTGGLHVPDPYPATLSRELLTSFSTCGYSRQQLFKYVVKIFRNTCGKYPNMPMLKAAVLADGELKQKEDMLEHHRDVIERKDQVMNQIEKVMEAKHQLTKTTIASIKQQHSEVLDSKDAEIVHRDYQLQENRLLLQGRDDQLQRIRQQLQDKIDQLQLFRQQLQENRQQLQENRQQLQGRDDQLQDKIDELQRIRQQFEEITVIAAEFSRKEAIGSPPLNPDSVTTCMFCCEEERMILFRPCNHICCGINCLPRFVNQPCPVCRVQIESWKFAFFCK